jgi:hypothetical protein
LPAAISIATGFPFQGKVLLGGVVEAEFALQDIHNSLEKSLVRLESICY